MHQGNGSAWRLLEIQGIVRIHLGSVTACRWLKHFKCKRVMQLIDTQDYNIWFVLIVAAARL